MQKYRRQAVTARTARYSFSRHGYAFELAILVVEFNVPRQTSRVGFPYIKDLEYPLHGHGHDDIRHNPCCSARDEHHTRAHPQVVRW